MIRLVALAILGILLTGCFERSPLNIPIAGYNFTDRTIKNIWVNKSWSGSVIQGGGGGAVCCVSIPFNYKPGEKITIDWEVYDCTISNNECAEKYKGKEWPTKMLHKVIEIPHYNSEDVAELQLAFLPNDEIRAYANGSLFSYEKHPSRNEFGDLLATGVRPLENEWKYR
ncbi:DUF3304 domain-containing protein [Chromobacterium phragmitis]|uniref:DUF3304 domain-containing protein n=1 Tax=Chromobacterium phragmitis TaxID=2202141 RepID=A0A344UL07_9NEIS|nr:DUF3304 domain-containing protein [Chromobacterium phragmitis]AXE35955.1 hypothetical protein DK843_17555 [Chromobacterium phragmitis]